MKIRIGFNGSFTGLLYSAGMYHEYEILLTNTHVHTNSFNLAEAPPANVITYI